MLPVEWASTMRPLQDKCEPTPYEDIEKLFITDMHHPLHQYFDDFDPDPIGVASLAQVHIARWRETGEMVAVKVCLFYACSGVLVCSSPHKLQHPHLQEFAEIDMEMVEVSLGENLAEWRSFITERAQDGSNTYSLSSNLPGLVRRCEKIFPRRWTSLTKHAMPFVPSMSSRILGRLYTSVCITFLPI